jgi:hypothetical protein
MLQAQGYAERPWQILWATDGQMSGEFAAKIPN